MADNSSPSQNPIKPNSQLMEAANAQLPPSSMAAVVAAPPSSDLTQIPQQQQQSNNIGGNSNSANGNLLAANYQMQNMQRSPSMTRLSQVQQQQLLMRHQGQNQQQQQQSGIYGQMNFGGVQNQQQQQMGNLARSGFMGQSANLPMLSGQPSAQFNMGAQYLSSPRQKPALMQGGAQLNNAGQALQGMQGMGMANLNPQLRPNAAAAYAQAQQRMTPTQLRQHLVQNGLTANQTQSVGRASFVTPQLSALAQNGQTSLVQNSLTQQQQQWSKQIAGISSPGSPSLRLQQQRQQQLLFSSAQLNQNSSVLSQQQLSQLVHQMGHPQMAPQQQQAQQQAQQPQQPQLVQQQQQQLIMQQQQQSPRAMAPAGQKSLSLTGSQPDATASGTTTPGGSSSQGTEASNQMLGKRKIQDLVSQLDPQGRLDPEVEDYLLQLADDFIDQVTSYACNLAKHRNSTTLESKDVLLHLEKNYQLTVPGFSSEEKANQQNHPSSDVHQKRMDVIRSLMESSSTSETSTSGEMPRQVPSNNQPGKNQMARPPSSDHMPSQSNVSQPNRF